MEEIRGDVRVEPLYFEGCPNWRRRLDTLERLAAELDLNAEVVSVQVSDEEAAAGQRFLGSPMVCIDRRDVEPEADERTDFALGCRVYSTGSGLSG